MSGVSEAQRLLLRAALARDSRGVKAWREWHDCTELTTLDPDSQWLLPLLGRNLRRLGVPELELARYENVYRHNWYRNHLALHRAALAIGVMRDDARVVILGGAAMAIAHYETIGERPFEVVDVLAPGAKPREVEPCHLARSLYAQAADAGLVQRTIELTWRSLRAHSLEPVDQLVDICARRNAWDSRSRLLWLTDAATLLSRNPALDWTQAEQRCEELGLGDAVASGRRELKAALPEAARMAA